MERRFRSVAGVSALLATALGVSVLACHTGSDALPEPDVGPTDGSLPDGTVADAGTESGADATPSPYPSCLDPHSVVVEGQDTGFVRCSNGAIHRTRVADCPVVARDAGVRCEQPPIGAECQRDSDCTARALGRCDTSCSCSYGCVSDSECPSTMLCACGEGGGSCTPTSCVTDAVCPAGSLCADDFAIQGCNSSRPFSCQTLGDQCLGRDGCPRADGGGPTCIIGDGGARECSDLLAQCPGRPFLVDGLARVAPLASTRSWLAEGVAPDVPRLTAHERDALGFHYNRAGTMEHASIAAFARFALELLALGAPAHLLEATHEAMEDETEHAKLTFALATAYLGAPSGPGPLAMDGALGPCTPQRVFATLVREGCIGETLAAVEATEALARATDPSVPVVRARIAADAARHATLAWRAAQWLVETHDADFRSWAADELARAVAERRTLPHASTGSAPDLEAHGLLGSGTLVALAAAALRDIVEPCGQALLGAAAAASARAAQARSAFGPVE